MLSFTSRLESVYDEMTQFPRSKALSCFAEVFPPVGKPVGGARWDSGKIAGGRQADIDDGEKTLELKSEWEGRNTRCAPSGFGQVTM